MDKEEFLANAMKANEEAVKDSKISDMVNKDSSFYQGIKVPPENIPDVAPPPPIDPNELQRLRTFQADISDAVRNESLSATKIAVAESRKQNDEPVSSPKRSKFAIFAVVLGLMFVLGGIAAVGYVLFLKDQQKKTMPTPIAAEPELIRSDSSATFFLENANERLFDNFLAKEIKNPPKQDGIKRIRIIESEENYNTSSILDLWALLESDVPQEISRSVNPDFFLGINYIKGSGEPLLVLNGSYENLYAGMLAWEKNLTDDMNPIFKLPNASSTSKAGFVDAIISNRDTRVNFVNDGSIRFFYTVLENYAIFAKSKETLDEIVKRLRENKLNQ